mmetsp:Transcript_116111/g.322852  ORF Transcript_116111/g.322852 Transcript_116111/m.322852 type:complete len:271 (-) Transcript_116111:5-817(-)
MASLRSETSFGGDAISPTRTSPSDNDQWQDMALKLSATAALSDASDAPRSACRTSAALLPSGGVTVIERRPPGQMWTRTCSGNVVSQAKDATASWIAKTNSLLIPAAFPNLSWSTLSTVIWKLTFQSSGCGATSGKSLVSHISWASDHNRRDRAIGMEAKLYAKTQGFFLSAYRFKSQLVMHLAAMSLMTSMISTSTQFLASRSAKLKSRAIVSSDSLPTARHRMRTNRFTTSLRAWGRSTTPAMRGRILDSRPPPHGKKHLGKRLQTRW